MVLRYLDVTRDSDYISLLRRISALVVVQLGFGLQMRSIFIDMNFRMFIELCGGRGL